MKPQETFTTVATHLLKQGKRATWMSGVCAYHDPNGLKCAVGCLIPDEEYDVDFDQGWSLPEVIAASPSLQKHDRALLRQLQRIHDSHKPETWEISLREFARTYGFEMPLTSSVETRS